ncbi:hypothetical protein BJV82DRAFT_639468 [Fennellomyces sp. T-0311]|nr:hypothetical protein BJV82DRAFT_639468 [Fennellomyces sp. T-0311]
MHLKMAGNLKATMKLVITIMMMGQISWIWTMMKLMFLVPVLPYLRNQASLMPKGMVLKTVMLEAKTLRHLSWVIILVEVILSLLTVSWILLVISISL